MLEIKQIEQVANRRHVPRHIGMAVLHWIRQVIPAAIAERGIKHPVSFDELHERGMLAIDVADMAASRERRHRDHRNARAGPEKIDRLDKASVLSFE